MRAHLHVHVKRANTRTALFACLIRFKFSAVIATFVLGTTDGNGGSGGGFVVNIFDGISK